MKRQQRPFEPNRETPLDNWDETIDPAVMSGDYWAEEENAPLEQAGIIDDNEKCADRDGAIMRDPAARFMHPTINVASGNDTFTKGANKNKEK